jgi:CheY-like chemotaxis protein
MYNILICDDEQDIVNALKIYLSGGDYCLFEAHNGREALEAVEKNDIHLILMDIMMPDMDGYEATRAIRLSEKVDAADIPIIALTANAFAEDAKAAHDAGMNAHLSKPLDFNKLKNILARIKKNGSVSL